MCESSATASETGPTCSRTASTAVSSDGSANATWTPAPRKPDGDGGHAPADLGREQLRRSPVDADGEEVEVRQRPLLREGARELVLEHPAVAEEHLADELAAGAALGQRLRQLGIGDEALADEQVAEARRLARSRPSGQRAEGSRRRGSSKGLLLPRPARGLAAQNASAERGNAVPLRKGIRGRRGRWAPWDE